MKKCNRCKKWIKISKFWNSKASKDGLDPRCIVCRLELQRLYRRRAKEKTSIVNPKAIKYSGFT